MSKIEVLFLGTAAADFSPRLKGDCADRFDKDARRASSMLLCGRYLVDCGPHCLDSMRIAGVDMTDVTDLFVTHTHSDHFDVDNVNRIADMRIERGLAPLKVWVNSDAKLPMTKNVDVVKMPYFENFAVDDGVSLIGLPANHDPDAFPQHLLFGFGAKTVFYGCDGAWLLNETVDVLRNKHIAFAVLDATTGDYLGDYRIGEHNSIPMLRLLIPSLRTLGALDDASVVCLSHLAPSLHEPHDETVEIVRKFGACVAYDGLRLEI